jgi:hypothetical protein
MSFPRIVSQVAILLAATLAFAQSQPKSAAQKVAPAQGIQHLTLVGTTTIKGAAAFRIVLVDFGSWHG